MHSFVIATDLAAPPDQVWRRVTSIAGINDELLPLIRMTVPPHLADATLDDLPLGQRAGRSWILLFGVLPVDYDDLTLTERGPGRRFFEQSRMLTQSRWWHERTVTETVGGCRLVDQLHWDGRFPPMGALYRLAIPVIFRHRHRRLSRRFGDVPTQ